MQAKQQTERQTTVIEQEPEGCLLGEILERTAEKLDRIAERYGEAMREPMGHLRRAMVLAEGIQRLKASITPEMMQRIMSLMNSPLGFLTDRPSKKEPTPYPEGTIRDVIVSALLSGVYPVGNEFNIIAGRLYIAQAGYRRLVQETAGLTDLRLSPGIPVTHNGRIVVRYGASWRVNGVEDRLVDAEGKPGRTFAIIAYEGSTADNIVGKAERKALKAIYQQIHGSEHTPMLPEIGEDGDASPPVPAENGKTRTEALADRLDAAKSGGMPMSAPDRQPGDEPRDILETPEHPFAEHTRGK